MTRWRARFPAAVAAGLALAACGQVVRVRASGPASRGAAGGRTVYAVGKLTFPVDSAWQASGDARHLTASHPDDLARLDVLLAEKVASDEGACLKEAEAALERGAAGATGVRRHPTTLAGRKGAAVEADQGPWHVWALAVCDGGDQLRISYYGSTPLRDDVVGAWTAFVEGARFEP